MEFFTRVLSGNSRIKERTRDAERVNEAFKSNLNGLKRLLESEESMDVSSLLDMVYESSFPEEQVFMKMPTRIRLRSKKELAVRLLIGLDALGVPAMTEMLAFINKHGIEGIAETLVSLFELLCPLLEGKETPNFTTDDVVDAMDFGWHSTSRTGSPLLNVIASAASSPRASAASVGDSPFHPTVAVSPFRRAVSDRSMFLSRSHELGSKSVLDKSMMSPARPTLTISASSQYPSLNKAFQSQELISDIPAITLPPVEENPDSYSLDGSQGLQKKHRRKSSSLRRLFAEETIEGLSEGSAGTLSKGNSGSPPRRKSSSEFAKFLMNVSEPSSPFLNRGASATEVPELNLSKDEDKHEVEISMSRKNSSPFLSPPDKAPVWREDPGGFTVELSANNNNAQNPASSPAVSSPKPSSHDVASSTQALGDAGMPISLSSDASITWKSDEKLPHESSIEGEEGIDMAKGLNTSSDKHDELKMREVESTQQKRAEKSAAYDIALIHDEHFRNVNASPVPSQLLQGDCTNETREVKFENLSSTEADSTIYTTPSKEVSSPTASIVDGSKITEHAGDVGMRTSPSSGAAMVLKMSTEDKSPHSSTTTLDSGKTEPMSSLSSTGLEDDEGVAMATEGFHSSSDSFDDLRMGQGEYFLLQVKNMEDFSAHENAPATDEFYPKENGPTLGELLMEVEQKSAMQRDIIFQRSHSDSNLERSISLNAEFMKEEKLRGSQSDRKSSLERLRPRFVERSGLVTAVSMESVIGKGRSPDRVVEVVMQESMPWIQKNIESVCKEGEDRHERELLETMSSSESDSDSSMSSSSSSSKGGLDREDHQQLHEHELEEESKKVDEHTHYELEEESEKVDEHIHHEDETHADPLQHPEEADKTDRGLNDDSGTIYSSQEATQHANGWSVEHHLQVKREMDAEEEGKNSHEGFGFQSILAPLLLPSSESDPAPVNVEEEDDTTRKEHSPSMEDTNGDVSNDGAVNFSKEGTDDVPSDALSQTTEQAANAHLVEAKLLSSGSPGEVIIVNATPVSHIGEGGNVIEQHQNDLRAILHAMYDASSVSHGVAISAARSVELVDDQNQNHKADAQLDVQVLPHGDDSSIDINSLSAADQVDVHQTRPHDEYSVPFIEKHEDLSKYSQCQMQEDLETRKQVDQGHNALENHVLNADNCCQEGNNLPTMHVDRREHVDTSNVQHSMALEANVLNDDRKAHEADEELPLSKSPDLEDHLRYSDSQFEQLLAEVDGTEDKALHAASGLAIAKTDAKDGKLEDHEGEIGSRFRDGITSSPDSGNRQMDIGDVRLDNTTSQPNNEFNVRNSQSDDGSLRLDLESYDVNLRSDDETPHSFVGNATSDNISMQSDPRLETNFVGLDGQFMVAGPGDLSGQIECKLPAEGPQTCQSHPNVQKDVHPNSEQDIMQSPRVVYEQTINSNDSSINAHVTENQGPPAAASSEGHNEEAMEATAHDRDRRGSIVDLKSDEEEEEMLKRPLIMVEGGTLEEEMAKRKPHWEASEAVDVGTIHPLQQKAQDLHEDDHSSVSGRACGQAPSILEQHDHDELQPWEVVADGVPLHGQPTYVTSASNHLEPHHVLNQSAADAVRDPRWDVDVNATPSRRNQSSMGKLARGCLACCRKPRINS